MNVCACDLVRGRHICLGLRTNCKNAPFNKSFTRACTGELIVLTPFSGKRPELRVLMLAMLFAECENASKCYDTCRQTI